MTNGDAIVDSESVARFGDEIGGHASRIHLSNEIPIPISSKPIASKG